MPSTYEIHGTLDTTDRSNLTRPNTFSDDYVLRGVSAGQQVQANLNAGFDTYLQLVDADTGVVIAANDDSNGTYNSQLSFTAQQGIDYILRTTSYGANVTGNYTLLTNTGTAIPGTPIPISQTLSGTLTNSDPINPTFSGRFSDDYLLRGISAGQQVQVNLNGGFDTYLQIVDADTGQVLFFDDDSGLGTNSQLSFTPQQGIDYLLRATSYGANVTGNYSLTTRNLINNNQTLTGNLSSSDPINPTRAGSFSDDYVLGGVTPGQQVNVNLSAGSFDTYLQLVDANTGQVLASDDDSGAGTNSYLTFTPQQGIDYLLRATSYGANATGNYTLTTSTETTRHFDLNFATNGQSMWDSGNAFSFEDNRFLGTTWNKSDSKTVGGVGVSGSTSGKLGLQSDFHLNGGSVNASLPIDLWLDVPDHVHSGDTVTISSRFSLDNAATFSTISPTASYALDLIYGLQANARIQGFGGSHDIFNVNVPQKQRNLLNIDANHSSFSMSEDQLHGFGSFDLHLPHINTQANTSGSNTLSANGSDTFFDGTLDLDKIATTLLGTPDLEDQFSWWRFSGDYNILDLTLASELSVRQQFNLVADKLIGHLTLENGQIIPFRVGEDVTFTVPEGIGDSLDMGAAFNLDANFSNRTTFGLDANLDLQALQASLHVDAPWPIPNFGFDFGPLVNQNIPLVDSNFDLYNQTFALGGLGTQSLNLSIPTAA